MTMLQGVCIALVLSLALVVRLALECYRLQCALTQCGLERLTQNEDLSIPDQTRSPVCRADSSQTAAWAPQDVVYRSMGK